MDIEGFKKDYYENMSKTNIICKYEISAYMYDTILKKVINIKRPRVSKFKTLIIVDKQPPKIIPPLRNMDINPISPKSPRRAIGGSDENIAEAQSTLRKSILLNDIRNKMNKATEVMNNTKATKKK